MHIRWSIVKIHYWNNVTFLITSRNAPTKGYSSDSKSKGTINRKQMFVIKSIDVDRTKKFNMWHPSVVHNMLLYIMLRLSQQMMTQFNVPCMRHSLQLAFMRLRVYIIYYQLHRQQFAMMTSSNEDIFRVTGHLCGEFTGPRWILHTKASDAELWCLLWSAPK